ncbi:putative pre-mRNA-splicing regulator WTAP [Helianthus annuus]|nr:putative pre-mRNA-splicing regulator WTAP [Helianthus annuus]
MKLALQKSQNLELRSHVEGLCKHMEGLTDDVEKSNEMVSVSLNPCAYNYLSS